MLKLERNMGTLDRVLRAIAGIVLVAVALLVGLGPLWMTVALVLAVLMLGTAVMGYCPAYRPLGMNTLGHDGTPKAA